MKSPFPGMDPYLERRWLDLHPELIVKSRATIQRQLGPDLTAGIGERVLVEDTLGYSRRIERDVRVVETTRPDSYSDWGSVVAAAATLTAPVHLTEISEPITQRFIEIIDRSTGGRVITAIEFVSPSNKVAGDGLEQYRQKQEECYNAKVSLVEIDLTRVGLRRLLCHRWARARQYESTYQISAWRASSPLGVDLYPISLRQRLPEISIPLRPHDADVKLDLQAVLDACYADARYDRSVDYRQPLDPPLDEPDAAWVRSLLAEKT
jgi:hypothetical protein